MKKVIIFGAYSFGLKLKRIMEKNGYNILFFCDNDKTKRNLILDNTNILSFDDLIDLFQEKNFNADIIIAIKEVDVIVDQIRNSNIVAQVYGLPLSFFEDNFYEEKSWLDKIYKINYHKPRLEYYEYHLAHHCNLKCKGCGHFSNIAAPEFGDYNQYVKDIQRLKELFWGVKRIRLMGGEPLLNPQWPEFVKITREIFPDTNLRMVSNGLLIPSLNIDQLKILSQYDIAFDITQYPPTSEIKGKIEMIFLNNNIRYSISAPVKEFLANLNIKGDSDIVESHKNCISKKCHFLLDGQLSLCPLPILHNKFKKIINSVIEENDIINIYDEKLNGFNLNKYLSEPIRSCRYCDNKNLKHFAWQGNYPYL